MQCMINDKNINFEIPGTLGVIQNYSTWFESKKERHYPYININEYLKEVELHPQLNILYLTLSQLDKNLINKLKKDSNIVLLIDTYNSHGMCEQRRLFIELLNSNCKTPVIIGRAYENLSANILQLYSATDIGGLLVDGFGYGVFIAA